MADYRVRVSKDYLVFSAGHFITFNRNICERLHGHNYQVEAEVLGRLDDNHYVVDFIALRDALQKITLELDHYMLLPTEHPMIRVEANDKEVVATFENKRWVFPREDCILLPIPNTTTELLAQYIGERLIRDMGTTLTNTATQIRIAVDENNGQWGEWIETSF
ncbi:MAG: 6-pyruvoyl tetrahydropterin synthase family protein [Planctomycetales bacterium]|nr:6-pyruvoyl tetrahydropterin synthase family protein [Planctomycetales bacterium]